MKRPKYVYRKIPTENGGYYRIGTISDFEGINPLDYFTEMFINSNMSLSLDILQREGIIYPEDVVRKVVLKNAIKDWQEKLDEINKTIIPEQLKQLLIAKKKSDQVRTLKNFALNSNDFIAFLIYAGKAYGYLLSQYKASHYNKGLDKTKLPSIVEIEENGNVNMVGSTTLSDAQLKQVVEHRHVTVSKFLDKGNQWHCFFLTYRSLRGEENHNDGKPHMHYISDKWGISRNSVVKQLTSKKYNLPCLPHVEYIRHGK